MLNAYITNLGKYTEGKLIGKWIEFPISNEDLKIVLNEIGINEYYEEYFFTDFESDVSTSILELSEYSSIEHLNELAELLENADFQALLEVESFESAKELLESGNYTFLEGMTLEELAEETVEGWNIPTHIKNYIDYEHLAHELSFDWTETENGLIRIE